MHTPEAEDHRFDRTPETRPRRWVCHCSTPPVLLATLDGNQINLKIRDRYYHIEGLHGRIQAICPRCGKQHTITIAAEGAGPDAPYDAT